MSEPRLAMNTNDNKKDKLHVSSEVKGKRKGEVKDYEPKADFHSFTTPSQALLRLARIPGSREELSF